jgi:uncharacterized protein YqjF (DUF2071 family)
MMSTFLKAAWRNLIMANYEIDADLLKPYLPKGVSLDYYEGKCYVSLVGFLFKDTHIFKIPIPFWGSFEEVNLRFYVVRKEAGVTKRGVVFINETVPNKIVAFIANKLYKEHYTAIPTKYHWQIDETQKQIEYQWKVKQTWNSIKVNASTEKEKMKSGSFEEFIFEHYYGYTKVNENKSLEYKVEHPSWEINQIKNYEINCDFSTFYGDSFKVLNHAKPSSVMLAEGSKVSIKWKRTEI